MVGCGAIGWLLLLLHNVKSVYAHACCAGPCRHQPRESKKLRPHSTSCGGECGCCCSCCVRINVSCKREVQASKHQLLWCRWLPLLLLRSPKLVHTHGLGPRVRIPRAFGDQPVQHLVLRRHQRPVDQRRQARLACLKRVGRNSNVRDGGSTGNVLERRPQPVEQLADRETAWR